MVLGSHVEIKLPYHDYVIYTFTPAPTCFGSGNIRKSHRSVSLPSAYQTLPGGRVALCEVARRICAMQKSGGDECERLGVAMERAPRQPKRKNKTCPATYLVGIN